MTRECRKQKNILSILCTASKKYATSAVTVILIISAGSFGNMREYLPASGEAKQAQMRYNKRIPSKYGIIEEHDHRRTLS